MSHGLSATAEFLVIYEEMVMKNKTLNGVLNKEYQCIKCKYVFICHIYADTKDVNVGKLDYMYNLLLVVDN